MQMVDKRTYKQGLAAMVFLAVFAAWPSAGAAAPKAKITRQEITSGGQKRTYYLFVPESVTTGKLAPLLVTLHGQGRNGRVLLEEWKGLAEKEGIILAGPDSLSAVWNLPRDGPEFVHDVEEEVRARYPVDPHRMYLFGHSAGGTFSLYMGLLESEFFAAVAVSAGGLRVPEETAVINYAARKIPVKLFVGTRDPLVPVKYVRAARDAMAAQGISVELLEIPDHTHDYYSRSTQINKEVWVFLREQRLASAPRYATHRFP